jgi:hypothetical protein
MMRTTAVSEKINRELPDAKVDADLSRVIKQWLEADAEFNHWFLETTKGKMDDSTLLALVEGYGGDQNDVETAWEIFTNGGPPVDLATTLHVSIARMKSLQDR